ncbi:MAG: hypothetical protein ABH857_01175 [Elusimicrobiota bacterium]
MISRKQLAGLIILITVVIIIYLPSLPRPFLWDDHTVIVQNEFVRDPQNIKNVFNKKYFELTKELSYRPVVSLTHLIDYTFYGLNPLGHDLTNLVLHLISAVLLYFFLILIIQSHAPAMAAVFLWALHPVHGEVVMCPSLREDSIVMIFYLICMIFMIKLLKRDGENRSRGVIFIIICVSYILGLLSKENMIMFIPSILVLDLCGKKVFKNWREWDLKKIMYYYVLGGISFLYLILRFIVMRSPSEETVVRPAQGIINNILTAGNVFIEYIGTLFYPKKPAVSYIAMTIDRHMLGIRGFAVIMFFIACIGIAVYLYKRNIKSFVMLFLFFILLLPVSNIITIANLKADRYLYLPSAFFICAIVYYVYNLGLANKKIFQAGKIISVIYILFFTAISISNTRYWADEYLFYKTNLEHSPDSAKLHFNMATVLMEREEYEEALNEYRQSLSNDRIKDKAYVQIGLITTLLNGAYNEAIFFFQEALSINPNNKEAEYCLAIAKSKIKEL